MGVVSSPDPTLCEGRVWRLRAVFLALGARADIAAVDVEQSSESDWSAVPRGRDSNLTAGNCAVML